MIRFWRFWNPNGQARDLYRLQNKLNRLKKDLEGLHIEAEIRGVKVVINGQQK